MVTISLADYRAGGRSERAVRRVSLLVCLVADIAFSAIVFALMSSPFSVFGTTYPLVKWHENTVTCYPNEGNVEDWLALVPDQNEVTFACEGAIPVPPNLTTPTVVRFVT